MAVEGGEVQRFVRFICSKRRELLFLGFEGVLSHTKQLNEKKQKRIIA